MMQASLLDWRAPAVDRPRLSRQCAEILEMLRSAPRTNAELAGVSLKYTSRVSDLRRAGYVVECERLKDGLTVYRIRG